MKLKSDAKFEEKLTLGFKNDMRNLVNFNASSNKSENLHFNVLLLLVAYNVSAKKSIDELSLMTLKKDLNFEEKLTSENFDYLKNDVRNLVKFSLSSGKSENLHFDGCFCRKYSMFELKRYRGVVL